MAPGRESHTCAASECRGSCSPAPMAFKRYPARRNPSFGGPGDLVLGMDGGRSCRTVARDDGVDGRNHEQREEGADPEAADDDPADRTAAFGAGPGGAGARYRPEAPRARGPAHRPPPPPRALDPRTAQSLASLLDLSLKIPHPHER